jgi:pimeloyl-ACP methyl ester carboxylesterase
LWGQVDELAGALIKHAEIPVTLIGWSWGAMLSLLSASKHPTLVRKLILISSAVYEDDYATDILKTRLGRMSKAEKSEFDTLVRKLNHPEFVDKNSYFLRLGNLIEEVDSYDRIPDEDDLLRVDYEIYRNVWREAEELRSTGKLLQIAGEVTCPVVAVHGDYDPHPADGVRLPLSQVMKDFRFILLKECSHTPWLECKAKDAFYDILKREI